jgi:hypothetical protein
MRFVYLMLIDLKLFMSMRIYINSTYASPA